MPKVRHLPDELAWLEARLRAMLPEVQRRASRSEWEEDRWFGSLRMASLTVDADAVVIMFAAPDGQCIGFRWPLYDKEYDSDALADGVEEAVTLCIANLEEDAVTQILTEPDAEGVRWLGDAD